MHQMNSRQVNKGNAVGTNAVYMKVLCIRQFAVQCEMKTQACLPSVGKQPSIILPALLPESNALMHATACFRPYRSLVPDGLRPYTVLVRNRPTKVPLTP